MLEMHPLQHPSDQESDRRIHDHSYSPVNVSQVLLEPKAERMACTGDTRMLRIYAQQTV